MGEPEPVEEKKEEEAKKEETTEKEEKKEEEKEKADEKKEEKEKETEDKEFFFGDEPAMLDLVVYSHVAQLVMIEKDYPCSLRDYLEADCKNLVGLVNRMKDRCWGDHWANATGEEMDLNPHIPKPEPAAEPEPVEEKKEEEAKKEETTEKEEKKEEEKEKADEKKEE